MAQKQKETIRAFIAVAVPPETTAVLRHISRQLSAQTPKGSARWVTPERIHLTLRFLGDTAVSQLPAIIQALDRAAAHHPAFTLRLGEPGCFPNRKRPRVVWVGLRDETAALPALKAEIDAELQPLGWEPEDRPFQAHLTLARVKDSRNWGNVRWDLAVEEGMVPVTAVHLIESELRPSGLIYTTRHSSRLRT